jgi:hypothetical protein
MNVIVWVLKKFWFPILIAVLGLFASRYPTVGKIHETLKKFR